jgi:methylated-DNA-protein-cysteine methyltransferase-like protein
LSVLSKSEEIYQWIQKIPKGSVATYGQIATKIPSCTPRMVGYAMARLPPELDIPWHRVLNAQGKISIRDPRYVREQKKRLEAEGIFFDKNEKIALKKVRWNPDL